MRLRLPLAVALLFALVPASAAAQELLNDGFVSGGSVHFSGGFVTGEMAAARFLPPAPAQVVRVRFLFGGAAGTRNVRLHVWDDSAATTSPGAELYAGDFSVTASDSAIQELDLSPMGVAVTGAFRVGIELTADGLPCVATDTDGTIHMAENFIDASGTGWTLASTLGVTGDFVVRAVVVVAGTDAGTPPTDAGVVTDAAAPHDAAALDAGATTDASTDASTATCRSNAECSVGQYCNPSGACSFDCRMDSDCAGGGTCSSLGQCIAPASSGCGCRVAPRGRDGLWVAGVALAWLAIRRRRR